MFVQEIAYRHGTAEAFTVLGMGDTEAEVQQNAIDKIVRHMISLGVPMTEDALVEKNLTKGELQIVLS